MAQSVVVRADLSASQQKIHRFIKRNLLADDCPKNVAFRSLCISPRLKVTTGLLWLVMNPNFLLKL